MRISDWRSDVCSSDRKWEENSIARRESNLCIKRIAQIAVHEYYIILPIDVSKKIGNPVDDRNPRVRPRDLVVCQCIYGIRLQFEKRVATNEIDVRRNRRIYAIWRCNKIMRVDRKGVV